MDIVGRFVDVFCKAAISKGDGTSPQDQLYYARMQEAYSCLMKHPHGQNRFESLLQHDNDWVKSWVAAQTLAESGNANALNVLTKLSKQNFITGFSATTTLDQHIKGMLSGPFK